MRRLARLCLVVFSLALAPPAAFAVDETATSTIRSIIEDQLEAFRHDDAATAYGFASPGIQRMFPTQDEFMSMVKRGYAPVYRPQSFTFARTTDINGTIAQEVRIVDADGGQWLALYTMEQQADGSWKISGCRLVKAPDQNV
ncbi:MAG: DUF4864 domain-containing protein [Alsobacter sp.]